MEFHFERPPADLLWSKAITQLNIDRERFDKARMKSLRRDKTKTKANPPTPQSGAALRVSIK